MRMPSVHAILMQRDGMSSDEASNLIDQFIEDAQDTPTLDGLEDLLKDYFGLEPDYVIEALSCL